MEILSVYVIHTKQAKQEEKHRKDFRRGDVRRSKQRQAESVLHYSFLGCTFIATNRAALVNHTVYNMPILLLPQSASKSYAKNVGLFNLPVVVSISISIVL